MSERRDDAERASARDRSEFEEPGRASLLAMLGIFAALSAIVVGSSLAWRAVHGPDDRRGGGSAGSREETGAADVRAFLGPLADGAPFEGWRIAALHPIDPRAGALHFELAREGEPSVEVVVMRFSDEAPEPIARTSSLAIYVRSERGSHTSESAVSASRALAIALAARESEGHRPPPLSTMQ